MGWKSSVAKFLAQHIGQSTLTAAGQQIGTAIGKKIGAKIYTPPTPEETKDEKPC